MEWAEGLIIFSLVLIILLGLSGGKLDFFDGWILSDLLDDIFKDD